MLEFEHKALKSGFSLVVGIDEAGRGPLAGPVVAAAVSLHETNFVNRIDDSKKLSPKSREKAFHEIYQKAFVGIGVLNESIIDRKNILETTLDAMNLALDDLFANLPDKNFPAQVHVLVDGNTFRTTLPVSYETIVGGDALSLSIACASIVAKVTRDRILEIYDRVYPQYGFARHKGYGTKEHYEAIRKFGLSKIHRLSFVSNLT